MTQLYDETVEIEGKRISVDDYIKITPSPGKKDGFIGKVRGWWITDEGVITAIDVWGGKPQHEKMRSFRPERVQVLSTRMQNSLKRADEARKNGADIPTGKTIGSITLRKGS